MANGSRTVILMKRRVIEPEQRRQAAEAREALRRVLEELDGAPDPETERAWPAQTQRPSQDLDSGSAETIPA